MRSAVALIASTLSLSLPQPAAAGPYEDCILQNMKGVQSDAAARAIAAACRVKTAPPDTTPHKCKELKTAADEARARTDPLQRFLQPSTWVDLTTEQAGAAYKDCLEECAKASWWDRTFGECKTGG